MNHEELVENWIERQPDYQLAITEAPVSVDSARSDKSIDIVIIEDYDPPLEKINRSAIESANSLNPRKTDKMEAVLAHAPDPLRVRVFEVKAGQITFKSIGQSLSYSELLPDSYRDTRSIEVIEKGIIYLESDLFIERAAEALGISLHQFTFD